MEAIINLQPQFPGVDGVSLKKMGDIIDISIPTGKNWGDRVPLSLAFVAVSMTVKIGRGYWTWNRLRENTDKERGIEYSYPTMIRLQTVRCTIVYRETENRLKYIVLDPPKLIKNIMANG